MAGNQELFTLYINCHDVYEVFCDGVIYRQILFDGTAEGEAFCGRILPGGVDTQVENPDGTGSLSARYILEGTDRAGRKCRMYIDNRAKLREEFTDPHCYSDSPALSRLKDAALRGRMINDEKGLRIIISDVSAR